MKKLTTMQILLVTAAVISTGAGKLAYGEARMTAPEFEIGASDVAVLSDVENEPEESASEDEADEDEPAETEDEPFTTDYGLTVTGGTLGSDFTYDSSVRVLTIISDTSVIISGTTPAPPNEKNGLEDKIVVRRRQILPSGML